MRQSQWQAMTAAAGLALAFGVAGCAANSSSIAPVTRNPSVNPVAATNDTPAPAPTPTPIQLAIAGLVGTPTWPNHDTATGAQGQQVAGLNCLLQLDEPYHHHAQLSIFVNGQQLAVPMGIGMYQPGAGASGYIYHQTCLYFLHTHDRTGILHMESKTGLPFALGTLFKLWGEPLSSTQIAQFTGPVSVYVNGIPDTIDPIESVPLDPGSDITLVIGDPPAWIPSYILPPSLQP